MLLRKITPVEDYEKNRVYLQGFPDDSTVILRPICQDSIQNLTSASFEYQGKDREVFRTLVESVVQMTTFISRIFLKLVELQFKVPISAE